MASGKGIGGFINNVIVAPLTGLLSGVTGAASGLIQSTTPMVTGVANSQFGAAAGSALGGPASNLLGALKPNEQTEETKKTNWVLIGGIAAACAAFIGLLIWAFKPKKYGK